MPVKMKTLIFVQHGTVTEATTLTPAVTTPMPQMARQARQKALALQQRAEWHQRLPGPTQPPHQQNNPQQAPAAGRRKTMANGPVQVLPQRLHDGEGEDAGFCEKWNNGEDTSDFLDGGTGGDAGAGDDGAGDEG